MRNAIITLSHFNMLDYMIDKGGSVVCCPETSLALWVKWPSIFAPKIIWHPIFWYPTILLPESALCTVPSHLWNDLLTFRISLCNTLYQAVFTFYLSILSASSTFLGIRMPNLRAVWQYFDFTLGIIRFRSLNASLTHQWNSGSSHILLPTAY